MGLLFVIIIIAIIYFLFKPHGLRFNPISNYEAEETLKKRFVTGEIDEETYLKMLKTLRS